MFGKTDEKISVFGPNGRFVTAVTDRSALDQTLTLLPPLG